MAGSIRPSGIDRHILGELRGLLAGQQGGIGQIVGVFVQESRRRLVVIHAALAQGDFEPLRLAAHTIRGSAEMIGAGRLADLGRELEEGAPGGNGAALVPLFQELRAEYELVEQALTRELGEAS
jgi:HPt (histidine-containing phosphotransfer) domain-containing protein